MSLEIEGAEKFARLARDLKAAGSRDLRRELYRGLNRAVKPMTAAAREGARERIGNKHGYGAEVSATIKVRSRRRAAGDNPSIILIGTKGRTDLASLNRGRLRHPLFGRWSTRRGRSTGYDTTITPGWWDVPLEAKAPVAQQDMVRAIDEVARKLAEG